MDGQDRVVRIDGQWTTIQCGKCNKCFKALTGEHKWQMSCIYCSHLIELHKPRDLGFRLLDPNEDMEAGEPTMSNQHLDHLS